MQVKFIPTRPAIVSDKLIYTFNNETITVTYNEQEEVFDFSEMPNGILESVETSLPINPIVKAERKDGELFVELLYYHGVNATQDELFPTWKEVDENGELREIESKTDVQDNGTN